MNVIILDLWETGRQILAYADTTLPRPQSLADLKHCSNVLLGEKVPGRGTEVLIGNVICFVSPAKVKHPWGGTMNVLEILF